MSSNVVGGRLSGMRDASEQPHNLLDVTFSSAEIRSKISSLRTCLWLDHALWLTGLEAGEFGRRYVEDGRDRFQDSKAVYKWLALKRNPSPGLVARIETKVPGTAWVFRLPLYDLLLPAPPSDSTLSKLRQTYLADPSLGWHFPLSDRPFTAAFLPPFKSQLPFAPALQPQAVSALVDRGDAWGLIGLLLCMRSAQRANDVDAVSLISRDLFRALPGFLQAPWTHRCWPHLRFLMEALRDSLPMVTTAFAVNWRLIEAYRDAAWYQPRRELRPREEDGRFVEYPDVIVEGSTIEGWRGGRLTRAAQEELMYQSTDAILSEILGVSESFASG
ncbi:hypothetical protein H9L17_09515 [Thermomonas brevis]|uniref:Uncharacterized protein n=1 Tax=Thermomonas brevis TaxID=215691 RepID=A0A7G9QQ42_9GAMM|nr:hypothetical protein [Thermomonas brevis]QNN45467.1 hypothetical protein H9L17_09515 [Thermomonas brevis]